MRPELDVLDCGLKKVLFHSGGQSFIYRSGVGKAKRLQIKSLECVGGKKTKIIGHREDVLHINTAGIGGYVLMARSHKRGIPVVVTAHNLAEILPGTFKFLQSSFAVGIYKWWLKKFYSSADVVVAPTNYVSRKLSQEYGVTFSIEIITNGVDIKAFESVSDVSRIKALKHIFGDSYFDLCSGISSKYPIVLAVGMQIARKGIVEFVELAKRMPNFEFVWVGKTICFSRTKEVNKVLREAKQLPNIHFVGYIEHSDLPAYFKIASAFLHLSTEETEGLAVLEALAASTPVIVRDIPVYEGWFADRVNCRKIPSMKSSACSADDSILITKNCKISNDELREIEKIIESTINSDTTGQVKAGHDVAFSRRLSAVGEKLIKLYQRLD